MREAECQRGLGLAEEFHEGVGKRFGSAGGLCQAPDHGDQAHQQGYGTESRTEAARHGGNHAIQRDSGGQSGERGNRDKGDEGMHLEVDDEDEDDGDGRHRNS